MQDPQSVSPTKKRSNMTDAMTGEKVVADHLKCEESLDPVKLDLNQQFKNISESHLDQMKKVKK